MNQEIMDGIRAQRWGLLLAFASIAFGWGLGVAFGAAEDSIKGKLKGDAAAVLDTVYSGDELKAKAVTDKSWIYCKRSHLHAGVLGASALALCMFLALVGPLTWWTTLGGILVGLGALLYGGVFWLMAAFKAPGMGGTGTAKEALEWLAIPSSGALVFGYLFCLAAALRAVFGRQAAAS